METHFSIPVKDLEESKNFYKEYFGFEPLNQWHRPELNITGLWTQNKEGFKLELLYHPDNENKNLYEGIMPHIGFEVSNLESKLKELVDDNVEVLMPLTKGVSIKRMAFIKDPNGLAIEVYEK